MLKRGSTGPLVTLLEQRIEKLGYYKGRIDGIFGPMLEGAVKAFQKKYGLAVDGIYGPMTDRELRAILELMPKNAKAPPKIKIRQDFVPKGNPNRPGILMKPQGLLYHSTNNWRDGAGDEAHTAYFKYRAGLKSVHAMVDKDSATQYIPWNEVAWHAGDGAKGHYNRNWIGLEIACEAVSEGEPLDKATYNNAVDVAAQIMKTNNLTTLKPHHVVYGKDCPHHTLFGRLKFEQDVLARLKQL